MSQVLGVPAESVKDFDVTRKCGRISSAGRSHCVGPSTEIVDLNSMDNANVVTDVSLRLYTNSQL